MLIFYEVVSVSIWVEVDFFRVVVNVLVYIVYQVLDVNYWTCLGARTHCLRLFVSHYHGSPVTIILAVNAVFFEGSCIASPISRQRSCSACITRFATCIALSRLSRCCVVFAATSSSTVSVAVYAETPRPVFFGRRPTRCKTLTAHLTWTTR